jgi:hypothetical protein
MKTITKRALITILALAFLFACARHSAPPVIGQWVDAHDATHQLVISQSGETLILEEKLARLPELNSKTPVSFKDGVLRLEGGGRQPMFYDAQRDVLTTQSNLGNLTFKRQR